MKRVAAAAALAILFVAAVGCEKREPLRVEMPPPASADAEAGALARKPEAGPGDAATDACTSLAAQYDAVHAAAGGTCTRDADCACYGDLRFDNQTGISDKRSAAELDRISAAYHVQHCPTVDVLVAGSTACKARCKAGSCR